MYTVSQVSQLAGVTVRTLHHYDHQGLLQPSRRGDNGYRLYGEADLLRLQQILFFRELGLELGHIGDLLRRPDFDQIHSLKQHRQALVRRQNRLQALIATVDHTIAHLEGDKPMSSHQLFQAFSEADQELLAQEAEAKYDPATVRRSQARWKANTASQQQAILDEGNHIYAALAAQLGAEPSSSAVQALVEQWRSHLSHFWTPTLEQLEPLARTYVDDPAFKANFDRLAPGLAEFVYQAVRAYVAAKGTEK